MAANNRLSSFDDCISYQYIAGTTIAAILSEDGKEEKHNGIDNRGNLQPFEGL